MLRSPTPVRGPAPFRGLQWGLPPQTSGNGAVSAFSSIRADIGTKSFPTTFVAEAVAEYSDDITFDIPGVALGDDFIVRVSLAIHGNLHSVLGRNGGGASAFVELQANKGNPFGSLGSVAVVEENGVVVIDRPTKTSDIHFANGVATPFTLRLTARSFLRNDFGIGASSARVDHFHTGGITGLEYFALDGTPLSGTFSSSSGNFALYDPAVPGTALLLGSGLALMACTRESASTRRTRQAT